MALKVKPEPNQPPPADPSAPVPPDKRNKRSPAQKAADALMIEDLSLKGYGLYAIAQEIGKVRPYKLSHTQVANDLNKLRRQWEAEAKAMINGEKASALRKLDKLERELWDAWERSKKDEMVRTMDKTGEVGSDGKAAGDAKTRDAVRKASRDGDAAFTKQILDIHDRRMKLLGLEAPSKFEHTGKGGGPVEIREAPPLDDAAMLAILARKRGRLPAASSEAPHVPGSN